MPLSASTLKRRTESVGNDIKTFVDGGVHTQAAAVVDINGQLIDARSVVNLAGNLIDPREVVSPAGAVIDPRAVVNPAGTLIDPRDSRMSQILDAGNSVTITSVTAVPWTGAWYPTRSAAIVRQLLVVASNVASGLGGTLTFEYSEDGSTATISEARTIISFATVRSSDLLNAGAFFRVKFNPSRALTGGEAIYVTTTHRMQNDGVFTRLVNQQMELANLAMQQNMVYIKAFRDDDLDEPIRSENGGLRVSSAKIATYFASFAPSAAPFTQTVNLTALNTSDQVVTIWHGASATKRVRIRRIHIQIASVSGAGTVAFDLMRLTGEPTGGTIVTPGRSQTSDGLTEATLRLMPTVDGAEQNRLTRNAVELVSSSRDINIYLFDESALSELKSPELRAGVAEGLAIVARSSSATVNIVVNVVYTEQ